ncbi:hypothetical protein NLU13_3755 [Sarocladium strictum]|uniref:Putative gamma-glutamylcyclotransferase n=1 Tax=Sarocladium strictum TaxID=5046 RepID=A0AA39GH12_SARSR|nr:hypothetical protein NLU13_7107 [Sarocladium strictum]KAK0390183.1 hypothetical protein NLU13_3755 [Sarocladium strictum]
MSISSKSTTSVPRPVFIYGTLCAKPLLAWVLTGSATQADEVASLIRPSKVDDVARYALHGRDYPAAVKKVGGSIHGFLLQPQTRSQRWKLDDFEGESYQIETVQARLLGDDGEICEDVIEADIYLWNGDTDLVSDLPWDLERFIRERLDDWIDLFEGMELVGDDDGD